MRFPSRNPTATGAPGVTGSLRVDRRTSALLRRLRPGDIAVLDHLDLDRATAEALLERRVGGVVNLSAFISGRYPNLGPELLARAGVPLVEAAPGQDVGKLSEGAAARMEGGTVYVGGASVLTGRSLSLETIVAEMDRARSGLATQLQSFTHNTTEFLRRDQGLLLHGQGVPELSTRVAGRPVVVVVARYDYRDDLRRLRRFIKEQRPVLVGVDAGADALLQAGHTPDLLVAGQHAFGHPAGAGEGRPVSDRAFRAAREVLVHADDTGRVVGAERLERIGVRAKRIAATGTTEDIGLLVADVLGASVVVTVGTHATLDEFLDHHRTGLASTFLTRLRVGPKLVDAKGVPQLYGGRPRVWLLLLVLLAGLAAVAVAVATTPVGQDWWDELRPWLTERLGGGAR